MEQFSLDNSLSSLSAKSSDVSAAVGQSANELEQADFIELLVAQIKNQDPTKPLDPSQFMNQLAQFSTVNGIQELKNSFDSLASRLSSEQSLQAASLVGRDVLVPGGIGKLTTGGSISGVVELPQQSSELYISIKNENGVEVRTMSMGGHDQGPVKFNWNGSGDDGSAVARGKYKVIAEALVDGELQAIEVEVETRVDSVTLNQDGSGTMLNLASGESMPLSFVEQIK
ncbi:MAG: flagellar hook assembly protein FlgD [Gammaproteobacteria bacterium]|nr:flagellar hook assembly protein FlgD [Gammaproteobacteria bacterium]